MNRSPAATPNLHDRIELAVSLIRGASSIVAMTGAGISTESGIPDYRGPGGVGRRNGRQPSATTSRTRRIARRSAQAFDRLPGAGRARAERRPSRAGRAGATRFFLAVITQNIDGLHQKAGTSPERVIELHGSAHRIRCVDCGEPGLRPDSTATRGRRGGSAVRRLWRNPPLRHCAFR